MNYIADSTEMPAEKSKNRGAPRSNLNAATTLVYVKNIETRVDGRSALGIGLRDHRLSLLGLFNVRDLAELDTLEQEAVRRLVKRRVIRELSWARIQNAVECNDTASYLAEVPRFQDAVNAEERSETRLETLLSKRQAKPVDITAGLAEAAKESHS